MREIKMFLLRLILAILPIDVALGNIIGGMSLINYIIILYILIVLFELMIGKNKKNIFLNKSCRVSLLILLAIIISLLFNDRDKLSVLHESAIYTIILSILFYNAALMESYNHLDKEKLKSSIKFGVIFICLAWIYTEFIGYNLDGRFSIVIGRIYDPNYFATGLNLIILTSIADLVNNKNRKLNFLITTILIILMVKTGSRTAMLACIVTIIFYIVIKYKNQFNKIVIYTFWGILIAIVFTHIFNDIIPKEVIERISITNIKEDGGSGRIEYWISGFKYMYYNFNIVNLIFGFGFGSFSLATLFYIGHIGAPHNMYVQMMFELGLLGVILLILIIYYNFKKAKMDNNPIMLALIIGLIVSGLTLDMILTRYFWIILFLNGISLYKDKQEKNNITL